MNIKDVFKALFVMPAQGPRFRMRCVTHDQTFTEAMEMGFHETMNLNCKWEKVRVEGAQ